MWLDRSSVAENGCGGLLLKAFPIRIAVDSCTSTIHHRGIQMRQAVVDKVICAANHHTQARIQRLMQHAFQSIPYDKIRLDKIRSYTTTKLSKSDREPMGSQGHIDR